MSLAAISGIDQSLGHEDQIFSILFKEDDLSWQTIIYELVKTEAMDPWNISVQIIAERFIVMLGKMKEMDFRISGKMVLAAALLLKIKSERLIKEDIVALDNLINAAEEDPEYLDELSDFAGLFAGNKEKPQLVPRTPQPRQRKVSVFDLVEALEKALEMETKKSYRKITTAAPKVAQPKKGKDMSELIGDVFKKINKGLGKKKTVMFNQLIPSPSKEDKVFTFIPLLHLDTQRKIDLLQKEHFGDISIKLLPGEF